MTNTWSCSVTPDTHLHRPTLFGLKAQLKKSFALQQEIRTNAPRSILRSCVSEPSSTRLLTTPPRSQLAKMNRKPVSHLLCTQMFTVSWCCCREFIRYLAEFHEMVSCSGAPGNALKYLRRAVALFLKCNFSFQLLSSELSDETIPEEEHLLLESKA